MLDSERHLFPLRASDHIRAITDIDNDQVIRLTDSERQRLLDYESELFNRLEQILDIKLGIHSVYPLYFTTEEGWKNFQDTYGQNQPEIYEWDKPQTVDEAAKLFWRIKNLKEIDKKKRDTIADTSMLYARDQFIAEAEKGQPVEKIEDPIRKSRVVNPDTIIKKVRKLREFKKTLKPSKDEETSDNKYQARMVIAELYKRYVNTRIANIYSNAVTFLLEENVTEEQRASIEAAFPSLKGKTGIALIEALSTIDKFYQGRQSSLLDVHVRDQLQKDTSNTSEMYEAQLKHQVSARDAQDLAQEILDAYGFSDRGWKVEFKKKPGMSVIPGRKVVRIPEDYQNSLPNLIRVLAHEIEGHVIRAENRDKLPLRLLREKGTGRGESLSEACAVWVETETMQRAYGIDREFHGTYYRIIQEKQKGRSFKYCYMVARERGNTPQEAFRRVLRIFSAGNIPLGDTSPFVPNTEELAYHEPTADLLIQQGLESLLFTPGIDVYSFRDLQRIGMLPLSEMQTPRFLLAQKAVDQI